MCQVNRMWYSAYAKQSIERIPLDTQYLLLDRLYTGLYALDTLQTLIGYWWADMYTVGNKTFPMFATSAQMHLYLSKYISQNHENNDAYCTMYTMYCPVDVCWHILNNIISTYFLCYYQVLWLNGVGGHLGYWTWRTQIGPCLVVFDR